MYTQHFYLSEETPAPRITRVGPSHARPQATCTDNSVKFGHVVFEICKRTDRWSKYVTCSLISSSSMIIRPNAPAKEIMIGKKVLYISQLRGRVTVKRVQQLLRFIVTICFVDTLFFLSQFLALINTGCAKMNS